MAITKKRVLLFLKGAAMGAADVVPGVSGGTVAFITGIYEELLNSIMAVDFAALTLLRKFEFRQFWAKINGSFLVTLFLGILASAFSLVRVVSYFLENNPIQLWSFFFGLIIISSILVSRQVKSWKPTVILSCIFGVAIAFLITSITPANTPDALWFVFLSGSLAICAMILPGISGSFIMILLGKYEFIISALKNLDFEVIITFALGCITGLMAFSRFISWLLAKYHDVAVALLAGFMIGSLNKIWPWKEVLTTYLDRHGELKPLDTKNILPTTFEQLGNEPMVLQAILFASLGILLVISIEKLAKRKQR